MSVECPAFFTARFSTTAQSLAELGEIAWILLFDVFSIMIFIGRGHFFAKSDKT